jgi:hypothetical protein
MYGPYRQAYRLSAYTNAPTNTVKQKNLPVVYAFFTIGNRIQMNLGILGNVKCTM